MDLMQPKVVRQCLVTKLGPLSYLVAGPESGRLIILLHGWPAVAETWKHQLQVLSALGFRTIAPDMPGYGESTKYDNVYSYSQKNLVELMLELLQHLERTKAIWIGHDWGSATIWALAAHHPEACDGVVSLSIPYRNLEMGYKEMLSSVNRLVYPIETYPNAQFDYMAYYERYAEKAIATLEASPSRTAKIFFAKGSPDAYGVPSRTATVLQDGGFFGGAQSAPDIALHRTVLDDHLYRCLCESFAKNGFYGATAYYLNDDRNFEYSKTSVNDGNLSMPALFISGKYDPVADTSLSNLADEMRQKCSNLAEVTVEGGHWIGLERPEEVNAVIVLWLARTFPYLWPKVVHMTFEINTK